jgi:hypothetical protein
MSTTAVQDFLTKVSEDQALQGELAKALESDNDRQAVTALANSPMGMNFHRMNSGLRFRPVRQILKSDKPLVN